MGGHGSTSGCRAWWTRLHVARERTVSLRTSSLSVYVLDLASDMPIVLMSLVVMDLGWGHVYRAYFLVTKAWAP
jgi:IS4 transposase